MKRLLVTLLHFFIWLGLTLCTVFLCALIEYDFELDPVNKSENLVIYWAVGAFTYPALRFIVQYIRNNESRNEVTVNNINKEKDYEKN